MSATFDLPFAADVTGKSQVSPSAEGSHGLICFNSFTKVGGGRGGLIMNEEDLQTPAGLAPQSFSVNS